MRREEGIVSINWRDHVSDLIKKQQQHFGLNYEGPPRMLDADEASFRVDCLEEEVHEYNEAVTLVEDYDALLDIIVFAAGALERMGLPLAEGIEAVVNANLQKSVGPNNKRGGFALDLIKPEGWVGPEVKLQAIIDRCAAEDGAFFTGRPNDHE